MEIRTVDGEYVTRSYTANPNQQWGSTAPLSNGQLAQSVAGAQVSTETALQLAAVYGSVALISDSIASLPIQQWKLGKSGDPVAMDPAPVIAQPWAPWPNFTQRDFITQGTMSYLLRGNLYGQALGFDDLMLPSQVQLIHPDHARVRKNQKGEIEVWYYNTKCPTDEVQRSMALSFAGGLEGLNPIAYMRNVLGLGLAQDRMSGAFFANSARPDGVIQVKGDLDLDEAKAMKESWLEAHQGINKAYLPAVLTGDATWQPITMNLADAQFLEQMQFTESVISGRIYRVPPHMLGMVDRDTSWGSGIEQQELGFVRNTLLIWLCRWEDLLSSWLPKRQFVTFDLSSRLRGDTLQRFSAWQIGRVCGFMSNLDIIREEGMPIPTDPAVLATLSDYAAPLNSAPVKPSTGGAGGDKAN